MDDLNEIAKTPDYILSEQNVRPAITAIVNGVFDQKQLNLAIAILTPAAKERAELIADAISGKDGRGSGGALIEIERCKQILKQGHDDFPELDEALRGLSERFKDLNGQDTVERITELVATAWTAQIANRRDVRNTEDMIVDIGLRVKTNAPKI